VSHVILAQGLVELMLFYCEQAAGFADAVGLRDEGYLDALVRMFAQALDAIRSLPDVGREALRQRLDQVALVCHNFGYGVADDLDALLEGAAW
jgi:hypothetical protein